jgi:hypothetical protein
MIIVRLLSPGPWLVGTTKAYSGVGADIVMESITLIDIGARGFECNRLLTPTTKGMGVRHRLVVRGVVTDSVRADLLLNFVTVDEFIWDEPHPWVVRVIAEEKFAPDHSFNP